MSFEHQLDFYLQVSFPRIKVQNYWDLGQDKRADFKWDKIADSENETKPPIPKMRQNRRFQKWDKTADFVNENKLL